LVDANSVSYPGGNPALAKDKAAASVESKLATAPSSAATNEASTPSATDKAPAAETTSAGKPVTPPSLFGPTGENRNK
jgi:hypothetical protein